MTALALASGLALPAKAQSGGGSGGGVTIANTAQLSFGHANQVVTVDSNTVTLSVTAHTTPVIELMRLSGGSPGTVMDASAAECQTPAGWVPVVQNSVQPFDPANVKLSPAEDYIPGDPVFVEVTSPDANLDPTVRDTITVTVNTAAGDTETLKLRETGPNTGIFLGFVNSDMNVTEAPADCSLALFRGGKVTGWYADATNPSGPISDFALVDPFGFVFSSTTTDPTNGASITLINDATGQPATVFGVDGVSAYPSTVISGQTIVDAGGKIYPNLPGEYQFPRVAPGSYHLLVVPPAGFTAPSKVPLATLESQTRNFSGVIFRPILPPASFGKSFTLQGDAEVQVDIPIDPHQGGLVIQKTASVTDASLGDLVQYKLQLQNPDASVATPGTVITDVMPPGFRYVAGSARRDGLKIPDPTISGDGRTLSFALGTLAASASTEVRYMVRLGAGVAVGDAVNRASASDGIGDASGMAEALIHVRPPFFTDAGTLVGRIVEGGCAPWNLDRKGVPGVRVLLEDGTFVVTDKDGRYHFEGVGLGLHVVQMDVDSLPADLEPQSCGRNTRTAGRAFSQFVEMKGGDLLRADFHVRRTANNLTTDDMSGAPTTTPANPEQSDSSIAGEGHDWLAGQGKGAPSFLFPAPDYNPRAPTTMAAIKHDAGQVVRLTVNGVASDPLALDGDDKSADGSIAVMTWRGLPLREGDNALVATVTDAHGAQVAQLTRTVHYANTPAKVELVPERSRLAADGLTRPVIAVRILDRSGHPVRAGITGAFQVAAPYTAAAALDAQQKHQLSGLEGAAPTWHVTGDDGIALIELAPTSQAGSVRIDVPMPGDNPAHPSQVSAWLSADRENWVVVGFAAGTLGFNTLSRHVAPLQTQGGPADFTDGQLAFYAKGRIKGSWLLTLAYDNKRTIDRQRGLLGAIDPDRYYSVYGDGTGQAYDAATTNRLYVRLERKAFYALFGDYQTDFNDTELGRYNRTLNGFKFERHGRVINVSGFAAQTTQVNVRDEIQGRGISGPYRLSTQNITPNTDQITIETRDRARSDLVVNTQVMTRNVDYDIDYATGEVTFSAPVLSTDANFNPNIIVAQYEVDSGGVKATQAGLRASASFWGGLIKAGLTLLHDGRKQQTASHDVVATDVILHPRADTQVKLEAAVSDPNATGLGAQTAYIAEVDHHSAALDLLGYYRREDAAYGLDEQSASDLGATKFGLDGKLHLAHGFGLTATGYHESYMANGASRDALDTRLDYTFKDWRLSAGLKFVQDQTVANGQADSDLLTLGVSHDYLNHKLQVTGSSDIALGKAQSVDFPARQQVSAAYTVNPNVRLILSKEIVEGEHFTAQTMRLAAEVQPWKGAHITGGLNDQAITEYGPRTFAQFGMTQSVAVSKRWTVDVAFDSSSTLTGKSPSNQLLNVNQPAASGGTSFATVSQTGAPAGVVAENFDSISLGAAYHAKTWTWDARAEARFGQIANTWNVRTSWLRQLDEGVVAAVSVRASETDTANGAVAGSSEIDASLAWRPLNSRWSVLDKLTLKDETARDTAQGQTLSGFGTLAADNGTSARVINNLAVNYDSDAEGEHGRGQWQVSAYYGAKYVAGRFDDDTYTGFVDVIGLNGRVDVSKMIDVGVNVSVQHAWSDRNLAFAVGPSIGVSPVVNTWISVGWNIVGFRDRDFQDANYTQDGPYITARLKFDQLSLAPLLNRLQGVRR